MERLVDHVMDGLLNAAWRFMVRQPRLFIFCLLALPYGCGVATGMAVR